VGRGLGLRRDGPKAEELRQKSFEEYSSLFVRSRVPGFGKGPWGEKKKILVQGEKKQGGGCVCLNGGVTLQDQTLCEPERTNRGWGGVSKEIFPTTKVKPFYVNMTSRNREIGVGELHPQANNVNKERLWSFNRKTTNGGSHRGGEKEKEIKGIVKGVQTKFF